MGKYLLPRRGSKEDAMSRELRLYKGEMFMEFPSDEVGDSRGRIIIGNGNDIYNNIDYATTSTNKFQPFITDPSIYVPRFKTSQPESQDPQFNPAADINAIGDGSSASTVSLPNTIGNIKSSLCKHCETSNYILKDHYDNIESYISNLHSLGTSYTYQPTVWIEGNQGSVSDYVSRYGYYWKTGSKVYFDVYVYGQSISSPSPTVQNANLYVTLPPRTNESYQVISFFAQPYYIYKDFLGLRSDDGLRISVKNIEDNIQCNYTTSIYSPRTLDTYDNFGFTYNNKFLRTSTPVSIPFGLGVRGFYVIVDPNNIN